jgi:hypothetical protein
MVVLPRTTPVLLGDLVPRPVRPVRPARPARRAGALVALLLLTGCASLADPGAGGGSAPVDPVQNGDGTPDAGAGNGDGSGDVTSTGTKLSITLDPGTGETTTVRLACDPAGGDHPDPRRACEALAAAGGARALDRPPPDEVCTQIFGGRQVANVDGVVEDEVVAARFTRTDGCEIARWDALAPLLEITS